MSYEIIARDIIQKSLIAEVAEAKFFSILADEVTSHNTEELSLCLRFVDKQQNILEEFIDSIILRRTTGEIISEAIIQTIHKYSLKVTYVVGQGYDGAANMSSDRVGGSG